MIKPDKYTNLKLSIIGISYVLLRSVKDKYVKLDKVFADVSAELGDDAKYNMMNALNFLYMTGKIDYNMRRDSIRRGSGKVEDK